MSDRLVLYTTSTDPADDAERLLAALRDCGLAAGAFEHAGELRHRAGEALMELVTFLGCSPYVALDPAMDDRFCHVAVRPLPAVAFLGGSDATPPRCRRCRTRIADWRGAVEAWRAAPKTPWRCPECGTEAGAPDLDWRHFAGFGNLCVELWGVQPELAVPGDRLLAILKETTGTGWDFYFATA